MEMQRKSLILTISLLILLFNGCNQQNNNEQRVRYYLYNYYDNNWLLVRNAVIIKEEVLNDSISRLQITNHNRTVNNELGIPVFYDKKLFQKSIFNGIYFSEDSIDYDLFFDFNSGKKIETNFPVYYFYGIGKKEIKLDTIKNYLEEEVEFYLKDKKDTDTNEIESNIGCKVIYIPQKVYNNYRSYNIYISNENGRSDYNQILFDINLPVPLFCCDIIQEDYYLLSEIIGFAEADKYVSEAYEAVLNDKLRQSAEPFSKEILFPSVWWYKIINEKWEQRVKTLYEKGNTVCQIADSLNTTEDAVRRILHSSLGVASTLRRAGGEAGVKN